jgi:hypothetical protein
VIPLPTIVTTGSVNIAAVVVDCRVSIATPTVHVIIRDVDLTGAVERGRLFTTVESRRLAALTEGDPL